MIKKLFQSLRRVSRSKRYRKIEALTQVESRSGFVLDLGGGPASFFASLYPHPEQVILVDVDYELVHQALGKTAAHVLVANGERLPFADRSIDTIVCNSVIEHVERPEAMAAEIRRVGRNYFVQTPNDGFPLETHSLIPIPLYNAIPWVKVQRLLCAVFGGDYDYVASVSYLAESKLRSLFPDAVIEYERAFGLIKSFYIYRIKA
jgi:2-polyprenyl-3-methyl-5-hydroxy-6-metoxy-1,4-benzoquinol methylase